MLINHWQCRTRPLSFPGLGPGTTRQWWSSFSEWQAWGLIQPAMMVTDHQLRQLMIHQNSNY